MGWVQCAEYSCPETGVDFYGYDVEIVHDVPDWHACGEACELVSTCKYWTWNTWNTCNLKSSDAGLLKDPEGISGVRGCT